MIVITKERIIKAMLILVMLVSSVTLCGFTLNKVKITSFKYEKIIDKEIVPGKEKEKSFYATNPAF